MLAYAAQNPRPAVRAGSPKALTLIVAGHAALIAAVLTAKPEIIDRVMAGPTTLINVPVPPPPPTDPVANPQPRRSVTQPSLSPQERPIVDMEQAPSFPLDAGPTIADLGTVADSGLTAVIDPPRRVPVLIGPRFATAANAVKPPYPNDKLRAEEEATLKLRLTIDSRGRVTAVEPVGAADPSFLEAARRHILRSWRYKPATEDGVAVPTITVISLSFRLEEA